MTGVPTTEATVLVLTALPVEMSAVLEHVKDPRPETLGQVVCEVGHFTTTQDRRWRVVAVEIGPGNVGTAASAPWLVANYAPDVVLFVGIAGSLKAEAGLGDVVVASSVHWAERGKTTPRGLLLREQPASASPLICQWSGRVARGGRWRERMKMTPPRVLNAFVQPIVSGEKVIASAASRRSLKTSFSDAYAVETEGFGLLRAASWFDGALIGVVRGISDGADAKKNDDAHGLAAAAAAAFTFEVLDQYSNGLPAGPATPTTTPPSVTPPTGQGGIAAGAIAPSFVTDLIEDEEFLDDDREEVEAAAKVVASAVDDAEATRIIDTLCSALDDASLTTRSIARRLRWFGSQFLRSGIGRLDAWDLEGTARRSPRGIAVIAAQPAVWQVLPKVVRRRVLTALVGRNEEPEPLSRRAIASLNDLLVANALGQTERDRVELAFRRAPYRDLFDNGVRLDTMVPWLLDALDSGDFARQNAAARFLNNVDDGPQAALVEGDDFSLGRSLVLAATGVFHSHGAAESMTPRSLSTWSSARLEGGLFGALTYPTGTDLSPTLTERVDALVGAAAVRGELAGLLDAVAGRIETTVTEVRASVMDSLLEDLAYLALRQDSEDEIAVDAFASRLRTIPATRPRRTVRRPR